MPGRSQGIVRYPCCGCTNDPEPRKKNPVVQPPEIPVPGTKPEVIPEDSNEEPTIPTREPEIKPETEPPDPSPGEVPLPEQKKTKHP